MSVPWRSSALPRWPLLALAGAGAAWSISTPAATAGGVTGWGTTTSTPDFFDSTRGPGVGFDMGLKLLFIDLSGELPAGAERLRDVRDAGPASAGRRGGRAARLRCGWPTGRAGPASFNRSWRAGSGSERPAPVKPPLNDAQISAKGIVGDAILGYAYYLDPFIAVGAEATFGYHYFFGGDVVNGSRPHSSGYHVLGLGTVTFHLGL